MNKPASLWSRCVIALIYAIATTAGLVPLASLEVAAAGAIGAFLGALVAGSQAVERLRLWVAVLVSLAAAAIAYGAIHWLLSRDFLVDAMGFANALRAASIAQASSVAFALACGLRAAARRRRAFAAIEVTLVALAGAQLVVAHRDGAINRPFELTDAILAQGGDPTLAFLAVGGAVVALLVVLLLVERRPLRALLHLVFVALLFFLLSDQLRVPDPPPSPLLKSPKDEDKPERKGQGKGGSSKENSEELQFRDNYDSDGRTVPLAVVLLHDDYSPPGGMYYFRQAVFSQYNGSRLVQTTVTGADTDVASAFPSQHVDLPQVPNALLDRTPVDTTVALLSEHARPFAIPTLQALEPLQNPDPARFRRLYRSTSMSLVAELSEFLGRPVVNEEWPQAVRDNYLQAPEDPRYKELAEKIVETLPEVLRNDSPARALAVSLWLGQEGTYSLRSGHASAADPTADFLFGDRVGYCVHFAHAAVYLMRTLGIPARVGAGYVVDEAARQGGSAILITGQNAHAWPEFYVAGTGWVVSDVVPERALDPPPSIPDPDLQRLLGEMARGLKPVPNQGPMPFEPAIKAARTLIFALKMALLAGLPALVALLYLIKVYRRISPWFASAKNTARLHYRAQLDRLAEASLVRNYGESREAFARRVSARVPSFARSTELSLSHTFGRQTAEPKTTHRHISRLFRRELRSALPWWRRLQALLDPFSFLRVR